MPSHFDQLILYTDGSLTPNGAGAAVIVLDVNGKLIHMENRILKPMTNNEAEYAALSLGLEIAAVLGAAIIEVRTDSEVMVYQMRGEFAVKSVRLKQRHWHACQLARSFLRVRYVHIPREDNVLADTLAGEASAGRHWSLGVR